MNIADDFDAIAKRLRELKQEDARKETDDLSPAQKILKWGKMIEAGRGKITEAKLTDRPLMIISQPRRIVAP